MLSFYLAGVVGFEPTQAVLETDVLPLTLYPYKLFTNPYISIKQNNLQDILIKNIDFLTYLQKNWILIKKTVAEMMWTLFSRH